MKKLDKASFLQKSLGERQLEGLNKAPFFPNKRQQQSMLMYNDLFVAPKQKELLKLKKFIPASDDTTFSIGKSGAIKATEEVIKRSQPKMDSGQVIQIDDGGESIVQELKEISKSPTNPLIHQQIEVIDIIEVIMNKYNSSQQNSGKPKGPGKKPST